MILTVQRTVHDHVADAVRRLFGLTDVPAFAVEVPPNRAMGDLAVTVAFQLARALRKSPKAIAEDIARECQHIPGVTRIDVAPNGYLNLYLDRPSFLLERLNRASSPAVAAGDKTIVEHTAINPNKAAHIGHLRNAALGDTLVRVLRFRGMPVETQNYIDDTGVQVADVIVGFREIERLSTDDVKRIAATTRFDYYCWDLYSRVTEWYDGDKSRLDIRGATLHDLEQGGNDVSDMGAVVVEAIVRAHLKTMARLNVGYDLLTYEGDILKLKFWAHAFDILKAQGAVFLQTEGRHAGCWVMRIDDGDQPAPDEPEEEAREKVIVRSNGVVTYVGKDIANQFWKFGLLGRDFNYTTFTEQAGGTTLWATTSQAGMPGAPPFGHASMIYNVIDSRQMYLQALLKQALRTLGHPKEAEHSVHFSYEMVALSHATAKELGYPEDMSEGRKPFVEVSGRKGLGVKIDDLLDLLTEKASTEVAKRNPELAAGEQGRVASQIAVAAIRYFMLKFSRSKLIVFDIEEALSFEGETGPYLQYAMVRAGNIFQKLKDREGVSESDLLGGLASSSPAEINGDATPRDEGDLLWGMVLEAARLDDIVEQVVRTLEFSLLAKYAFGLAQLFNGFYHRCPILSEEDADRKRWRAAGVSYVRAQLTRALDLMGIDVPSRM
ncbi:MAG TPA: arginine--tRNA ligase [Vicinamibacterales bacterium]|jgi:arginyl-tRNA synthetase|nr:arginine--tRNA ligase [Vicinamibacterales bacterium]